ncbi:MAG: response regulator [bacterium]
MIEDEKELAEGLQQMLSLFGHQVDLAFGGREGLHQFAEGTYDLVFTDLGMPNLSGLDVAEAIKTQTPSIPILLITGSGDHVDLSEVKGLGIDGVVAKPFRIGEIVQAMRQITSPSH